MHGPLEKQPRDSKSVYRNWDIKLFALPVLLVVALIGFVVSHPGASKWISDAAQAEFVGTDLAGSADARCPADQQKSGPSRPIDWLARDWRRVRS